MKERGRPSKYNLKLATEICEQVADGMNIKTVLQSDYKYPSFPTWCKWKRENTELLNLYVNSIADKSESVDQEIDNTIKALKNGKLEPSEANVIIQTLKWKAAKYYPKMFGDNKQIDHTTKGDKVSIPVISFFDTEESED